MGDGCADEKHQLNKRGVSKLAACGRLGRARSLDSDAVPADEQIV